MLNCFCLKHSLCSARHSAVLHALRLLPLLPVTKTHYIDVVASTSNSPPEAPRNLVTQLLTKPAGEWLSVVLEVFSLHGPVPSKLNAFRSTLQLLCRFFRQPPKHSYGSRYRLPNNFSLFSHIIPFSSLFPVHVITESFCSLFVSMRIVSTAFVTLHTYPHLVPGVKRNFWLANFLTSRNVRMHRVTFYMQNTLRKLMIKA